MQCEQSHFTKKYVAGKELSQTAFVRYAYLSIFTQLHVIAKKNRCTVNCPSRNAFGANIFSNLAFS